jgi:pentapeptide MXKDX repeat protein
MRRWLLVTAMALIAAVPANGFAQTPSGDKMKGDKMKMEQGDKMKMEQGDKMKVEQGDNMKGQMKDDKMMKDKMSGDKMEKKDDKVEKK